MISAFHELIKLIQIDIRYQGTDHAALRTANPCSFVLLPHHHSTFEELSDQHQNTAIRHLLSNLTNDDVMIQSVETFGQIHVDHPLSVIAPNKQTRFINRYDSSGLCDNRNLRGENSDQIWAQADCAALAERLGPEPLEFPAYVRHPLL